MTFSTNRAKSALLLTSLSSVMFAGACQSADAASAMTADVGFYDAAVHLCVSPGESAASPQSTERNSTCL